MRGRTDKITPLEAVKLRIDELRRPLRTSCRRVAGHAGVSYSRLGRGLGQGDIADITDITDITLGNLISFANYFGMTLREFLDSEVFDLIGMQGQYTVRVRDDSGIRDLRGLHRKSEEWILWNNSKWWCRDDI